MSQSTLIISNNIEELNSHRSEFFKDVSNFDRLIINPEKSIGIDSIKELIQFSKSPPFNSTYKKVVINMANLMTIEAQNSMLKILEEPPIYLKIILFAENLSNILETIISRCDINFSKHSSRGEIDQNSQFDSFFNSPLSEKIANIPQTKIKEELIIFCTELLNCCHAKFLKEPNLKSLSNLKKVTNCWLKLNSNTNPSASIFDLIISL